MYKLFKHLLPLQCGSHDEFSDKPYLIITEQPNSDYRFRYKSEVKKAPSILRGITSSNRNKTFPTVTLFNHNQPAFIRCTLYQKSKQMLHPHKLLKLRNQLNSVENGDPHIVEVSPHIGYKASFTNMSIVYTPKNSVMDELKRKQIKNLKLELGRDPIPNELNQIEKNFQRQNSIDKNRVCLCFEALGKHTDGKLMRICDPVYSNIISNMKSSVTGKLKIIRSSLNSGPASGNTEIFLLTERISKSNIRIRFYEVNVFGEMLWEGFGDFSEKDVHHQYAIILRTPNYYNQFITSPVSVKMQLVRISDDAKSEPIDFTYLPNNQLI